MTTKQLKGLARRTEASNRAFAKMTRPMKRVTIAKDVIAALEKSQLIAERGRYIENERFDDMPDADQLQDVLPTIPPCVVCAKGAIFVCAAARRDKATIRDAMTFSGDAGDLEDIFSPDMFHEIEEDFEHGFPGRDGAKKRMIAIMKNIIANDGDYVP